MTKNFFFPLNIFYTLQTTKPIVWTSQINLPNHYFIFLPNTWQFSLNKILQKDLFLSQTQLIETSAIDTLKYFKINSDFDLFIKKNRLILFYTYFSFFNKLRLTFLFLNNKTNNTKFTSIDSIFKNANWLEREVAEMYGVYFHLKSDTRKLLLDYTFTEFPMLKDFTCENSQDVFYNIFDEKVSYIRNNIIEL